MKDRKGEKIAWMASWIGAFIWVPILSIVFLFQGKKEQGLLGIVLTGLAVISVVLFAPWRFSSTPHGRLLCAPYGIFFLSIAWAIGTYGGFSAMGLNWWNLLWLLPVLTPFVILGKRKWSDSVQSKASAEEAVPLR